MTRVAIKPEMLRWARERADLDVLDLETRFPKLSVWEEGKSHPTLKQLEAFANAVHVPIGYLFLPSPPKEKMPIPDFRTLAGQQVRQPSPNLLDTIYVCQERQSWYREFAQATRQAPLSFIGSASISDAPEAVAKNIRTKLGFDINSRSKCGTWEDALRLFLNQVDGVGVLAMVSGVVLNNNRRSLDVGEFRGFAISDPLAPLIFINGNDAKAAQMFTLAHELAHLWLGASAVSNAGAQHSQGLRREETWCNKVAAELLVPLSALRDALSNSEPIEKTVARLIRHFKVSTLVILRRLWDAGYINQSTFDAEWANELARLRMIKEKSSGGGDFYRTTVARISRRFSQALVVSTLEGQTLYRDAFRMLGISKTATFENLGREIGVVL